MHQFMSSCSLYDLYILDMIICLLSYMRVCNVEVSALE
jgi:hypothetical protein